MEQRLQELRNEFRRGQQQMALLDERRRELQETLLRISGAIQVLEELIAQKDPQQTEEVMGEMVP